MSVQRERGCRPQRAGASAEELNGSEGSQEPAGCVVFASNRGFALANSRKSLIDKFVNRGWNVVLATADDEHSRSLCGPNVRLEPVVFRRKACTPISDLRAYRRLADIFVRHRPSLVQNYHVKPVVLGTIAAKRSQDGHAKVVNTITGLGQALERGRVGTILAGAAYRTALKAADVTVFQNEEDRALFLRRRWIGAAKARLVVSSGVDLDRFQSPRRMDVVDGRTTVVMVTRLLRQKGVEEFVEVARKIKESGIDVRFLIAGEEEKARPDRVSIEWLRAQEEVEYVGHVASVEKLYGLADLLLFPSYYREGVPRVILEAAASGLPTVGFDVAGVRDAVEDGRTGYVVPAGDTAALTRRVMELLVDGELRRRMGAQARRRAEENFSLQSVNREYVRIYRELGLAIE